MCLVLQLLGIPILPIKSNPAQPHWDTQAESSGTARCGSGSGPGQRLGSSPGGTGRAYGWEAGTKEGSRNRAVLEGSGQPGDSLGPGAGVTPKLP
jgi:hypothetical protein